KNNFWKSAQVTVTNQASPPLAESVEAKSARPSERLQRGRRRIQRSRSSTELFADLLANLMKQSLQGVLNGRRKVGIGTCVHHLT
nr:hypothetical protein [Tanacetum cinerariifolium]